MSPDEVKEDLDALKAEEQADAVEEKEEKFMEEEMKEAGINSKHFSPCKRTTRNFSRRSLWSAFFVNTWKTRSINLESILIKMLIARKVLMEQ